MGDDTHLMELGICLDYEGECVLTDEDCKACKPWLAHWDALEIVSFA